ncbi:CBP4-domain-containing protein [Aulographum hederae CBS 113979]|uniref:Cytochrome b mRNA-processing protein 4 n=1 Tax=Aulographum hederae CBS 113979 TaxID=1176131 RepID=A0A6G1H7W6_9PEZI|nr:CBP4-domain-containing protein [Aulographum hederae CBS 113979]
MPNANTWIKMMGWGTLLAVGGPALVIWVTPTEEELFKRYNPDLQRRSLENREQKQQEFDDFVSRLKIYAKSDKPIWWAEKEYLAQEKKEKAKLQKQRLKYEKEAEEMRKKEMRESLMQDQQ